MMDRRVRVFLEALEDGRWHTHFPQKEITTKVPDGCVYLGLAKRKLTKIKGEPRHFQGHFKITRKGRAALKAGTHPTRTEFSLVLRYDVHV